MDQDEVAFARSEVRHGHLSPGRSPSTPTAARAETLGLYRSFCGSRNAALHGAMSPFRPKAQPNGLGRSVEPNGKSDEPNGLGRSVELNGNSDEPNGLGRSGEPAPGDQLRPGGPGQSVKSSRSVADRMTSAEWSDRRPTPNRCSRSACLRCAGVHQADKSGISARNRSRAAATRRWLRSIRPVRAPCRCTSPSVRPSRSPRNPGRAGRERRKR